MYIYSGLSDEKWDVSASGLPELHAQPCGCKLNSLVSAIALLCPTPCACINTIERFAAALGVSPSWLAYGEGSEDAVQAEPTAMSVGQRLEAARKARAMTRQALGIASGLTGQTVANIEYKGMRPRVDTVEMLAKVLGVSASWLAFGDGCAASVRNEIVPKP